MKHVETLDKAAAGEIAGDWRAAAFLLERKFREEFGRELKIDQTTTARISLTGLSQDEARAAVRNRIAGIGV
jgi:hypothetical protein